MKVAVGSSDGFTVNEHFGRCNRFLIYEVDDEGLYLQSGSREIGNPASSQGHEQSRLEAVAEALADCSYVLVSQIGHGATAVLNNVGITALAVEAPIDKALNRLISFLHSGRGAILQ
ncbi:Predicted Fe-Mo cluster-binding protein, NifX family [Paenibacillus sophorae]|uniref:Nitrogen fixation protein NifX n=1 Tax=Paenibacillus sophorae TaxID=1333845 RepID=A0A1H8G4K5_9BACL|nr:NifB/NifX family molybdenum-iron cluster-binding protein [Paenibacillus sophorae]QWU14086.1 nitrogen fixation protein NifX [Paenibacillus sophorae]SEN38700.1 Predicted Fe-Mo cluster-binding protein, NifX family [Paenibacillus sophorae]